MTLSSPEPRSAPVSVPEAADPRQDPAMRTLFRMSRTAGVGLQDYAAVNVLAVVGVLLAVASVLVLIFADVGPLLTIPAAAIVVSIIAFVQISRSNGTQTGKLIAIAGVVVAALLGGSNVYGRLTIAARQRADERAIGELVQRFSDAALSNKPAEAYELFDTRFHESVKPETFERILAMRVEKQFGGPRVTAMRVGDRFDFETDANGVNFATGLLVVSADGKSPDGLPYRSEDAAEFRNVDGVWKFRAIPSWYMQTKPSTPARPGT